MKPDDLPPDLLDLARRTDASISAPPPGSEEAKAAAEAAARAEQQQPKLTLEQELAGVFVMAGAGVGVWLPSVKTVLTEEACAEVGKVLAPLATKYGIDRFVAGFAWRAELQAIMVLGPLGMALAGAVRHDLAELKRKQLAAEGHTLTQDLGAGDPPAAASSSTTDGQPGMLQPIKKDPPA